MADYDKPNFYTGHIYTDDEWWVTFNGGAPYWEGPLDKVIEQLVAYQRSDWTGRQHPGKGRMTYKGNGIYRLTFRNWND